jgi:tetratricopeptide (TPR) repeat protein
MSYLDPLIDENDPLHDIFYRYTASYQQFMITAQQIASISPTRPVFDGITQELVRCSQRPFVDSPPDTTEIRQRNLLLLQRPKSDSDLIRLATMSLRLCDFYTASLCYSDLFARSAELSEGQKYLASIVLTRLKSWPTIISILNNVADRLVVPYRLDAHFRLALAYKYTRRYEDAHRSLRICQNQPPPLLSKTDITVELSHVCFLEGNMGAALTLFDRGAVWTPALVHQQSFLCLISDDPAKLQIGRQLLVNYKASAMSANLLYLRGRILYKLDDMREAWESLEESLQIDPESSIGWCALGNVYVRLEQLQEAIQCYTRAITFDHDMLEAWLNYAAVIELCPELREQTRSFEAQFPDMPVTIRPGRDRLATIVEPNDRDRFPPAALLVEDIYLGEMPALAPEILDDDSLLTESRPAENSTAEDGDSGGLSESESERESDNDDNEAPRADEQAPPAGQIQDP